MSVGTDLHVDLVRRPPEGTTAVLVPATSEAPAPEGVDPDYLAACGFEGKLDQVATVPGIDGEPATVVVGLGPADSLDGTALRRAAAVGVRATLRHEVVAVRLLDAVDNDDRVGAAQALGEGIVLGAYRFRRYKSGEDHARLRTVGVVGTVGKRLGGSLELGTQVGKAQCLARDLVNEPGGALTPTRFAEIAQEVAEAPGLEAVVMDEQALEEAGLGGLLGVNRGSTQPPRLVQLTWEPDNPRGTVALVGKGITFDAGGLSIKTADGMMTMKNDMSGAAAVLGAFSALPAVTPRCRVRAFLPLTDNMLGGDATRPGDVLRIRNGTTVEVLNTDAEGRLALADALALATEEKPDAIVDLATLTGAVDVALGPFCAGLMANDEAWADEVSEAGARAGEQAWKLPLPAEYRRWLDSDIADLRNISKVRSAGALTAGLFLSEFVSEDIPWAHLDIAATAWANDTRGTDAAGGTGYGVRLLIELLRSFRPR